MIMAGKIAAAPKTMTMMIFQCIQPGFDVGDGGNGGNWSEGDNMSVCGDSAVKAGGDDAVDDDTVNADGVGGGGKTTAADGGGGVGVGE